MTILFAVLAAGATGHRATERRAGPAPIESTARSRAPASAAPNPFAQHALPAAERRSLRGTVVTRLDAGSYAYLRVRENSGAEAWLVSLAVTTPKQDRVRALVLGQADHFHSRRLDRDFSPLLFAAVRSDAP
jgi:hypothetical protein